MSLELSMAKMETALDRMCRGCRHRVSGDFGFECDLPWDSEPEPGCRCAEPSDSLRELAEDMAD